MKRRYLVLGMIAVALKGKPQAADSGYQKREIPKTDIEIVYSMYNQDGNHSAVTGGIGTEKLNVYAPGFNLGFQREKHSFAFSGGVDIIGSASTDNIDYVVSSASLVDFRTHADLDFNRDAGKNVELGIGTGFSFESDYLSFPVRAAFNYTAPNKMRQVHATIAAFFDDLRWGRRAGPGITPPETLIYPSELRYKEWYDTHNRYTYNIKTGFVQVINKRLVMAAYPELIIQRGLIETPFHRVYFKDSTLKVENFPEQRIRIPMGLKANYFAGSRTILKAKYNFYNDNFGIKAHSLSLEIAVKISPKITLSPFGQGYTQTASKYFRPYRDHDPDAEFYTSDYDHSKFSSIKAGIGMRIAPYRYFGKRAMFNEINLRYAYFGRGDGLKAHMITTAFLLSREKKSKQK